MGKAPPRRGVQVISRAGAILKALAVSPSGLTGGELATTAKLPRTTVQRLADTLSKEGLILRGGGTARYYLGPEIIRLTEKF